MVVFVMQKSIESTLVGKITTWKSKGSGFKSHLDTVLQLNDRKQFLTKLLTTNQPPISNPDD